MDIWNYIIIVLISLIKTIVSSAPHQRGLQERIINSKTVCGNTPGLTVRQTRLCGQNPHSVASAIQGMQIAIHECKEQFKDERWNCSALETKNKNPHTSAFLANAEGNKESAFSFAIASAGVAHQVAHACSLGKIKECECPQSQVSRHLTASERKKIQQQINEDVHPVMTQQPVQTFERAGCNHNINYGMEFAVKFLDSTRERDLVSRTRSHNNRVGRLIVANNMKKNCRCHGTSGSCSQKTCWEHTPDFRAVGEVIKQKYNNAVRVDAVEESNEVRQSQTTERNPFQYEDLIYLDRSPSYCNANPSIGIPGTIGRYCDSSAGRNISNSCENLCCRRGFRKLKTKIVEHCKCRFHWCCFVKCETCERIETVSVCN